MKVKIGTVSANYEAKKSNTHEHFNFTQLIRKHRRLTVIEYNSNLNFTIFCKNTLNTLQELKYLRKWNLFRLWYKQCMNQTVENIITQLVKFSWKRLQIIGYKNATTEIRNAILTGRLVSTTNDWVADGPPARWKYNPPLQISIVMARYLGSTHNNDTSNTFLLHNAISAIWENAGVVTNASAPIAIMGKLMCNSNIFEYIC